MKSGYRKRSIKLAAPVICPVSFDETALLKVRDDIGDTVPGQKKLLFDYPTVYIVNQDDDGQVIAYVGETSDIIQRTRQHIRTDPSVRDDWGMFADDKQSTMYVVGHELFNKSLTLDIENRLMLWLSGVEAIKQLNNRRTNPQGDYYTREYFDAVFDSIWLGLQKANARMFPTAEVVRQSALFKASPFHELNSEQEEAKLLIAEAIDRVRAQNEVGQLILVEGAAGSGKTVLLSSLFYELCNQHSGAPLLANEVVGEESSAEKSSEGVNALEARLLVNHEEQLKVYERIAKKLNLVNKGEEKVLKPTRFINIMNSDSPVDVVLIDEAHLLFTQGKQSYRGKNQLFDILDRARVVVAVFDPYQVTAKNGYWAPEVLEGVRKRAAEVIHLRQQMRISGSNETVRWIEKFVKDGSIENIPSDPTYDLQVFDSPHALRDAIREKASVEESGLSRLVATYDWQYRGKKRPEDGGLWGVKIGDFFMPWNHELEIDPQIKRRHGNDAWAEVPTTIDEVGSHFTIQGFDLNYVGVIIGPSVIYRDGCINFVEAASQNAHVKGMRTLDDGSKVNASSELLRNQLNILMTRGVNGLYVYACDEELNHALKNARAGLL